MAVISLFPGLAMAQVIDPVVDPFDPGPIIDPVADPFGPGIVDPLVDPTVPGVVDPFAPTVPPVNPVAGPVAPVVSPEADFDPFAPLAGVCGFGMVSALGICMLGLTFMKITDRR